MTSIRKKNAASKKKTVRPILTNPFALEWPTLQPAAQAQIEAALRDVLLPLVSARESHFTRRTSDVDLEPGIAVDRPEAAGGGSVASTSSTTIEQLSARSAQESADRKTSDLSKRAARRIQIRKAQQIRDAKLPPDTHVIHLRSGQDVHVPNSLIPDRFLPRISLNNTQIMATKPDICDSLLIGINAVTKALEEDVNNARRDLAGLPALNKETITSTESLRLHVPAPTQTTRRQRRTARQHFYPKEMEARKVRKDRVQFQDELPVNLCNVPLGEPALISTLRQALDEVLEVTSDQYKRDLAVRYIMEITKAVEGLHVNEEVYRSDPMVSYPETFRPWPPVEQTSTKETLYSCADTPSFVTIPTLLVYRLLYGVGSILSSTMLDTLITSLDRFDPAWFRLKDKIHRQRDDKLSKAMFNPSPFAHLQPAVAKIPSQIQYRSRPVRLIFVAKEDINPIEIVKHLLTCTAAHNSVNIALRQRKASQGSPDVKCFEDVYIVPMAKGAEARIADLLGIRRAAVIAFTDTEAQSFDVLLRLVKSHMLEPVYANWLIPVSNGITFHPTHLPTHVKHLETETPVDPKAVRAKRKADGKARIVKRKRGLQKAEVKTKQSVRKTGLIATQS